MQDTFQSNKINPRPKIKSMRNIHDNKKKYMAEQSTIQTLLMDHYIDLVFWAQFIDGSNEGFLIPKALINVSCCLVVTCELLED